MNLLELHLTETTNAFNNLTDVNFESSFGNSNIQKGGVFDLFGNANYKTTEATLDAARSKNFKFVYDMIKYNLVDFNQKDADGNTVLHYLVSTSTPNIEIIEKILVSDKQNLSVNMQNKDGNTPLHLATIHGLHDIASLLVENGADKTIKNAKGYNVDTETEVSPNAFQKQELANGNNVFEFNIEQHDVLVTEEEANKILAPLMQLLNKRKYIYTTSSPSSCAEAKQQLLNEYGIENVTENVDVLKPTVDEFFAKMSDKVERNAEQKEQNTEQLISNIESLFTNKQQQPQQPQQQTNLNGGYRHEEQNTEQLIGNIESILNNAQRRNVCKHASHLSGGCGCGNKNTNGLSGGVFVKDNNIDTENLINEIERKLYKDNGNNQPNQYNTEHLINSIEKNYISFAKQWGGKRKNKMRNNVKSSGVRKLRKYLESDIQADIDRGVELGKIIHNQTTEIIERVIKNIQNVISENKKDFKEIEADEDTARAIKSILWKSIRDKNPDSTALDIAIEMEQIINKDRLKKITSKEIQEVKQVLRERRVNKQNIPKNVSSESNISATSTDMVSTPTYISETSPY